MTDLELTDEIKRLIGNQFEIPHEDIEDESLLDEDLGITDLDLEDLIPKLEEKYDIKIPQDIVSSFKKVSDIASYIYENADATV